MSVVTDPCTFDKGGCSNFCESNPDTLEVFCSCEDGFKLGDNGKDCEHNRTECEEDEEYDNDAKGCVSKFTSNIESPKLHTT